MSGSSNSREQLISDDASAQTSTSDTPSQASSTRCSKCSLFHRSSSHNPTPSSSSSSVNNGISTLVAASAGPTLHVMGEAHNLHNPFAVGALGEDGKKKRVSKRSRLANAAGRSLSPFRFHSHHSNHSSSGSATQQRSPSIAPLPKDQRKEGDGEASDSDSSDEEQGKAKGSNGGAGTQGLIPRNSAFTSAPDVDDDDDWERIAPHHHDASGAPKPGLGPRNDSLDGSTTTTTTQDMQALRVKDSSSEDETTTEEEAEEEDDYLDFDDETIDNTLRNAGCIGLHDAWKTDSEPAGYGRNDYDAAHAGAGPAGHEEDEHLAAAPNVVLGEDQKPPKPKREGSTIIDQEHALSASRPVFERNRCTITLVHGDYERAAATTKRPKRYIVASDGSDEASYAIEWCIGTVLRDGDETLVCSVMETDAKLDASNPAHEDKAQRMQNQKLRQSMAVILARQATAVLQRTRLAVKISCQALHARNARHMLIDMCEFFMPHMCIVGSRGLGSLKGILLGSTSHYLVQKSPVPVMVARRRLRLPALPRGKSDVVSSVRARHMRLDQAAIEKEPSATEDKEEEEAKEEVENDGVGADAETKDAKATTHEEDEETQATPTQDRIPTSSSTTTTDDANEAAAPPPPAKEEKPKPLCPEDLAEAEAGKDRGRTRSVETGDEDAPERGRSRSRNERGSEA